jgi:hypothetical protein
MERILVQGQPGKKLVRLNLNQQVRGGGAHLSPQRWLETQMRGPWAKKKERERKSPEPIQK